MKAREKGVLVGEVLKSLEVSAPSGTAESWDNVGLLVGDPESRTRSAIVSIDLTRESIELAVKKKAGLIVNHHPCIFPRSRGLSRFVSGHLAFEAASRGISVIACHTNFDRCALEAVDAVSQGLGATPMGRLIEAGGPHLKKLVVFVPETHLEGVREALCQAGAGHVGKYDSCSFGTSGEGTFRGSEDTRPFLGKPGKLERVQEVRLETVFPIGMEKPVLTALFASHPYEEVAFDLYAVDQAPSRLGIVRGLGYGFWGEFPSPTGKPFSEIAEDAKSLFNIDGFWVTDPPPRRVRKIAFVAGKGSSFLESAAAVDCDLFITGETGYHDALRGARQGMAVMEIGHRESERFFLLTMRAWLGKLGLSVSQVNTSTQKIFTGE